MRDSTAQGMMPGSPEAWEGRNLVNTCPNEASESISIYAKIKCQLSDRLIKIKLKQGRYGHLKLQGP